MNAPRMLYIVGVPGSGKTTTLRAALADHNTEATFTHPFLHTIHGWYHAVQNVKGLRETARIIELGARRDGGFGGTDALPMNVQPKVVDWLEATQPAYVIAEGDRLGNAKFFRSVRELGYELDIVLLAVPPEAAERRRWLRARALGTQPQNEAWVRGRITKIHNLVERYEDDVTVIVGEFPPEETARMLRGHPFFYGLLPPFLG